MTILKRKSHFSLIPPSHTLALYYSDKWQGTLLSEVERDTNHELLRIGTFVLPPLRLVPRIDLTQFLTTLEYLRKKF